MRRRGGGRDAGEVAGAARGGRGRPRTREGARTRAQENLRARSIEKVLEREEEWDGGGERPGAAGTGDFEPERMADGEGVSPFQSLRGF